MKKILQLLFFILSIISIVSLAFFERSVIALIVGIIAIIGIIVICINDDLQNGTKELICIHSGKALLLLVAIFIMYYSNISTVKIATMSIISILSGVLTIFDVMRETNL